MDEMTGDNRMDQMLQEVGGINSSSFLRPTASESRDSMHQPRMLSIGENRPFPPHLPDSKHYLVDFERPGDPMHPYNWELFTKYVPLSHCSAMILWRFKGSITEKF